MVWDGEEAALSVLENEIVKVILLVDLFPLSIYPCYCWLLLFTCVYSLI